MVIPSRVNAIREPSIYFVHATKVGYCTPDSHYLNTSHCHPHSPCTSPYLTNPQRFRPIHGCSFRLFPSGWLRLERPACGEEFENRFEESEEESLDEIRNVPMLQPISILPPTLS